MTEGAPRVRCRTCGRDCIESRGTYVHAEIQTKSAHIADPNRSDLRKLRQWREAHPE